jgi:rRNA maturation RNase YbeY
MRDAAGPPTILLGDVVISLPTAARQAVECGTSLDEEVVRLIIHGVLHLIGYDHERSEEEAERMRRKEKEIIRLLLPLPNLF